MLYMYIVLYKYLYRLVGNRKKKSSSKSDSTFSASWWKCVIQSNDCLCVISVCVSKRQEEEEEKGIKCASVFTLRKIHYDSGTHLYGFNFSLFDTFIISIPTFTCCFTLSLNVQAIDSHAWQKMAWEEWCVQKVFLLEKWTGQPSK